MLVLVLVGVSYYAVRQTASLMDLGVSAYIRCAGPVRARDLDALGAQLVSAAGTSYMLASAQSCSAQGRDFQVIGLRSGQITVSAIFTRARDQDEFPRALAGHVVKTDGIELHEATRQAYSVAAFESAGWLGYVVSSLAGPQNDELAKRLAPVMNRYLNH